MLSYEPLSEYEHMDASGSFSHGPSLPRGNTVERQTRKDPITGLEVLKKSVRPSRGFRATFDNTETNRFPREGRGVPRVASAFGSGSSVRLEGRTDATFDGGSFRVANLKIRDSEECDCGDGDKCVKATGVLNSKYSVKTHVILPTVSQFPDLSKSQKKRLQNAITNVLAPHEQKHVAAFNKYRGSTSNPFSLTLCKGDLDGTIQSMFETEEASRRQSAQAESDSLDPFFFDVDLD